MSGKSLPWLPWFHRDFLAATQGWTLLERGAYFMLLNAQWEMGALPNDQRRLAGIIGAQLEELEAVWRVVGSKFEKTAAGLLNRRLEQHRAKQTDRSEKARQSARQRWGKGEDDNPPDDASADTDADANASETHPKTDANGHANGYANSMLPEPEPEQKKLSAASRPRVARAELHQQIIGVYHELLPDFPQIREWAKGRQSALDRRIDERVAAGKPADGVDYWRAIFEKVAASPFLSGRNGNKRKRDVGGLGWLIKLNKDRTCSNLVDVLEGVYDG